MGRRPPNSRRDVCSARAEASRERPADATLSLGHQSPGHEHLMSVPGGWPWPWPAAGGGPQGAPAQTSATSSDSRVPGADLGVHPLSSSRASQATRGTSSRVVVAAAGRLPQFVSIRARDSRPTPEGPISATTCVVNASHRGGEQQGVPDDEVWGNCCTRLPTSGWSEWVPGRRGSRLMGFSGHHGESAKQRKLGRQRRFQGRSPGAHRLGGGCIADHPDSLRER